MVKKFSVAVLTIMFIAIGCVASYAGSWEQANGSWKYKNDSGAYSANTWQWIDGKCYCFDKDGNMYANTTTPDGYTVNNDGAWMVNGVVQIQSTQGKAVSSTNDRLYYFNKWSGLPGESREVVQQKMLNAIYVDNHIFTDYTDPKYPKPKTYEAYKSFLTSIDWPNMSEMDRLEACFKRCATGYCGNYYSFEVPMDCEDIVLVHKTGVCKDYSGALTNLCRLVGLEAYDEGRVYGGNEHALTKVKIDGIWYAVDPTWAHGQPISAVMYRYDDPKVLEIYGEQTGIYY